MNQRSSAQVPARQLIWLLLLAVSLIVAVVLIVLNAQGATEPSTVVSLLRVWSFLTLVLMIWSFIYVERESALVQIGLITAAVLFLFVTLQIHSFSGSGSPAQVIAGGATLSGSSPASDTTQSGQGAQASDNSGKAAAKSNQGGGSGKPALTGKIRDDIIGLWQVVGAKETSEFFKDGTLIGKDEKGQPTLARYVFLDSTRLHILLPKGVPKKPFIMSDLSITGDILKMTNTVTGGDPVSYRRSSSANDPANLAGTWKEVSGQSFIISTDGSFYFDQDYGSWNWTGQELVAKNLVNNEATWHLHLSSDGNTLAGTWTSPRGGSGKATLKRHPVFASLKDQLVGKWQEPGANASVEFRSNGEVIFNTEAGKSASANYAVSGDGHIQFMKKGASEAGIVWRVIDVQENVVKLKLPEDKEGVMVRVY